MEIKLLKITLRGLRIAAILSVLLISSFSLLSFKTDRAFNDIWEQLGIKERDAANRIKESFLEGYLQHYGVRNFKNIAVGDRTAVTADLLAFTKQYVQGESFKKAYEETRKSRTPIEPKKPKTEEEIRQENLKSLNEGLANLEKGMKAADAEMKKVLQGSYDMLQQQIKEYKDPQSEQVKSMVSYEQMQYDQRLTEYNNEVKKWEKNYPIEPNQFIKLRLQEMLDATKTVDYAAQLTERNGKKYFVKAEYERKSTNWKYAFRAGKEVTETARASAQEWMKELK